ncbi:hypothetical protein QE152_g4977 [Popillia japonica]|uniref:Uncharacterized protein n=1 Tax=Popillia japonica TaxID=7064 RepID=A0AAW1MS19_POPJA
MGGVASLARSCDEKTDRKTSHYSKRSPYLVADSANVSAISQLPLTRVTDLSIRRLSSSYPIRSFYLRVCMFDAVRVATNMQTHGETEPSEELGEKEGNVANILENKGRTYTHTYTGIEWKIVLFYLRRKMRGGYIANGSLSSGKSSCSIYGGK